MSMSISRENINAIKIHLMLKLSIEALHFKLTEIIKSNNASNSPYEIWNFLKTNYPIFKSNPFMEICARPLNKYFEKKIIGPLLPEPNDLHLFDMTACFQMATNILNISEKNVESLKTIRDEYFHSSYEIKNEDFSRLFNELKSIIESFYKNADETLKQACQSEIRSIELSTIKQNLISHIQSTIPYSRNNDLVENLQLELLDSSLAQSRLVLLYGPPGIGKTSQALEYAYKKSELRKEWNVQWFGAETKEKFFYRFASVE